MIKFLFGKSNDFCREVMAHLIAKEAPEAMSNIDEVIDKWFDWFNSPAAGAYNGDVLTSRRYFLWTNTYFIDNGCNKENVGECMKEFCKAFGEHAENVFKIYENIDERSFVGNRYLTVYDFDKFHRICEQKSIFLQKYLGNDFAINETYAIRAMELFDEKFEWLSEYGFHSNWKVEFCTIVSVLQNIITTLEQTKMTFVPDPSPTEYQIKAQAFLEKYLKFEERPKIVLRFLD